MMMSFAINRFLLGLLVITALYHVAWMWGTRALAIEMLSPPVHLIFLYAVPLGLSVAIGRLVGVLENWRSSIQKWLLVLVSGVVVPLVSLQIILAVSCVFTRDCL
jgi:hypothetical protein